MGIVGKLLGTVVPMGDVEFELAQKLIGRRQFAAALAHLELALEKPLKTYSRTIVLTAIGRCYLELGQLDQAFERTEEALREDANNQTAIMNMGVICRMKGEYEQSEMYYRRAIELKPKYADPHANLGALYIFQDKYAEAIEHLERALQLDRSLPVGHANLAVAYAGVGRFGDAQEEVKKAVARGYHDPDALKTRIEEMRKLEEVGKAPSVARA